MNMLKSVIGIFAMLLGTVMISHGQSFEFAQDSSSLNGEAGMIIKVENGITNLTQDTVEFRWVRAASNLPADWQKCGVCDNNKCYNDADSATFFLLPSDNGNMSINFYPFDEESNPIEGSGSLTVQVYPVDSGKSHAKEAFFKASTNSTSIENAKANNFQIYPNPTREVLKLETEANGDQKVAIFNSAGVRVKSMQLTGSQSIYELKVNDLKPGTYILRYQTPNGKRTTQPFIKE